MTVAERDSIHISPMFGSPRRPSAGHGSELLERLVREEGLRVVGAEYSRDTGLVTFFDDIPEGG